MREIDHATKRVALADAFRSATGDIFDAKIATVVGGTEVFKVYCRENQSGDGVTSRELVKETLGTRTNDYNKLADITFSRDYGISCDDLVCMSMWMV